MPSQTIQQQPHQAQPAPIMQMVCRKGQEEGQEKVQTPIQCCYEQNWWTGTLHQLEGGATPVVVAMVMGVDAAVMVVMVVIMVMVVVRVVGAALK